MFLYLSRQLALMKILKTQASLSKNCSSIPEPLVHLMLPSWSPSSQGSSSALLEDGLDHSDPVLFQVAYLVAEHLTKFGT